MPSDTGHRYAEFKDTATIILNNGQESLNVSEDLVAPNGAWTIIGDSELGMIETTSVPGTFKIGGEKTALVTNVLTSAQYVSSQGEITLPAGQYKVEYVDQVYYVNDGEKITVYTDCTIDLSTIKSTVAFPHLPENTHTIDEIHAMEPIAIDQVVIGSCTNGRLDDLRIAAEVLKGRKVHPLVRLLVVPASQTVYMQALKEGLMDIFMEAGAIVMNANCSVCWGSCQGVIGEGETLISTGTRNFKGRAGHKDSFVYLASAATVAASAVKGEIITADRLEA